MSFKVATQRSIRNLRMNVLGIPVASGAPSFFTPPYFAWGWGENLYGKLGVNDRTPRSSPIILFGGSNAWQSIAIADNHMLALGYNGSIWTAGINDQGQLGDNTVISKSSPVQTIAGGTNWSKIAVGRRNNAAIKTDGTLWMWGHNAYGQLGDNTGINQSSPVQTVAGGTNWSSIDGDNLAFGAIKTDGTLWMWGNNGQGQLGDNTNIQRASPVQTIAGGTNWSQVNTGRIHTIALKNDGTLWAWGSNNRGALGDGFQTNISSPIQTISGGTNWSKISAGGYNSAAIKTDGTLWMWGSNSAYQIGDGGPTATRIMSPVQTISGGTNWYSVSSGGYYTAAIKNDGTLWTWGGGGVLGDNTTNGASSPVQTIAGGTNWRFVSAGGAGNNFTTANAAIVALRTA